MNRKDSKIILIVVTVVLIAAAGYSVFVKKQEPAQQNVSVSVQSFVNPNGKYSFEFPVAWRAAINQYNNDNSLFGPDATSTSGLGGVEIFPNEASIDAFLGGVSAKYTNKTDAIVDGVPGIRVNYEFFPINGEQVVLLKDGKIYNIYVNSDKSGDLAYFNQIVSSFKFIK